MKRLAVLLVLAVGTLVMTGCPNTNATQRQQVAQASQNASIIVQGFQSGEVAMYQQGKTCQATTPTAGCIVVSDEDHAFIQRELTTVAEIGKTVDSCINTTTATAGIVTCLNTATTNVTQIYNDGGLYIKSPQAKQNFQLAMLGVKTALAVISTTLGGQ
jgi:hypothetical protein